MLIPGRKPVGPVQIDWTHPLTDGLGVASYVLEHNKRIRDNILGAGDYGYGSGYESAVTTFRYSGNGLQAYYDNSLPSSRGYYPRYKNLSSGSIRLSVSNVVAVGLGALWSFRTAISTATNTLVWRNTDSAVNFRINGSTVVLTSSRQIYSGGDLDIIFQWDDSANIRQLFVNGVLEDDDSTAFTWADSSTNQFQLFADGSGAGTTEAWLNFWEVREGVVLSKGEVMSLHRDPYQFLIPA